VVNSGRYGWIVGHSEVGPDQETSNDPLGIMVPEHACGAGVYKRLVPRWMRGFLRTKQHVRLNSTYLTRGEHILE